MYGTVSRIKVRPEHQVTLVMSPTDLGLEDGSGFARGIKKEGAA